MMTPMQSGATGGAEIDEKGFFHGKNKK